MILKIALLCSVLIACVASNDKNRLPEINKSHLVHQSKIDSIAKKVYINSASYIIIEDAPTPQSVEIVCEKSNEELNYELARYKNVLLLSDGDTILENGKFQRQTEMLFVVEFNMVGLWLNIEDEEIHKKLKKCRLLFRNQMEEIIISNENWDVSIETNFVKRRIM